MKKLFITLAFMAFIGSISAQRNLSWEQDGKKCSINLYTGNFSITFYDNARNAFTIYGPNYDFEINASSGSIYYNVDNTVRSIGGTSIYYNVDNTVRSIGGTSIYYNVDNTVRSIGGTSIYYNVDNTVRSIGGTSIYYNVDNTVRSVGGASIYYNVDNTVRSISGRVR